MAKGSKKDKYTVTEVGTLIEALRSEFKPILEQIPGMKERLDNVYEQVGKNTEKLGLLEIAVRRIPGIEKKVDSILEELKSKADQKDLETLEKKVAALTA